MISITSRYNRLFRKCETILSSHTYTRLGKSMRRQESWLDRSVVELDWKFDDFADFFSDLLHTTAHTCVTNTPFYDARLAR